MNNYINNDTITAISTPVGVGAIAMIRMSGSESLEILDCFFRHSANTTIGHRTCVYGQIYDNCELVDEVIVTYYKSPESYTGEDMVEISCHGSVYIQQTIFLTLTLSFWHWDAGLKLLLWQKLNFFREKVFGEIILKKIF